jgi:hypothetical protein
MVADISNKLISALNAYPLTQYCFTIYIKWICANVQGDYEEYDLIDAIEKSETDRLGKCEELLVN